MSRLAETSVQVQKRLVEILGDNSKSVGDIDAQISALRQHTAEQQALLSKFQQGYDYSVNKVLILGLVRAIESMDERLDELGNLEASALVTEFKDNILITLESQNVDQFAPEAGASYKDHIKIAKASPVPTDDSSLVGTIASVVKPGYAHVGGDSPKVIRPAEVGVYVASSTNEQGDTDE